MESVEFGNEKKESSGLYITYVEKKKNTKLK